MPSYHLTTGRSKLNQSVHKNSNYSKIKHMLDAISYKLFNNFLISTPIVTIMQVFISVPMILTLVPIPPIIVLIYLMLMSFLLNAMIYIINRMNCIRDIGTGGPEGPWPLQFLANYEKVPLQNQKMPLPNP